MLSKNKMVKIKTLRNYLENLHIIVKIIFLIFGASIFFILFPFLIRYGKSIYIIFFFLLLSFGLVFRIVSTKRVFRITLWLWASGAIIYIIIALFLILKNIQPLPYLKMDRFSLILYYLSYPLRVLGIFFTGLIFSNITSPVDFLGWGELGLKIALSYRAFEYSVSSFEENRVALLIQDKWPDFSVRNKGFKIVFMVIKYAPVLIATTFRNLILWFPWAWICYNNIRKEIINKNR